MIEPFHLPPTREAMEREIQRRVDAIILKNFEDWCREQEEKECRTKAEN